VIRDFVAISCFAGTDHHTKQRRPKMELRKTCIIAIAGASLAGGWAFAQDDDESTIDVITDPAGELPEASLQRSEEGATNSADGQAIAAANREAAAERAEEGLARAREAAANAAEAAIEALANAGPPEDLPAGPPEGLPPGPPEGLPAPPEDPGPPADLPTPPEPPTPPVGE
jgi:hypothetical protein